MVLASGGQGKIKIFQFGENRFFGKFPQAVNLCLTDCSQSDGDE